MQNQELWKNLGRTLFAAAVTTLFLASCDAQGVNSPEAVLQPGHPQRLAAAADLTVDLVAGNYITVVGIPDLTPQGNFSFKYVVAPHVCFIDNLKATATCTGCKPGTTPSAHIVPDIKGADAGQNFIVKGAAERVIPADHNFAVKVSVEGTPVIVEIHDPSGNPALGAYQMRFNRSERWTGHFEGVEQNRIKWNWELNYGRIKNNDGSIGLSKYLKIVDGEHDQRVTLKNTVIAPQIFRSAELVLEAMSTTNKVGCTRTASVNVTSL